MQPVAAVLALFAVCIFAAAIHIRPRVWKQAIIACLRHRAERRTVDALREMRYNDIYLGRSK